MSSVRRIVVFLTATVVAALTAATPAFAGPAPLIEPAPAPPFEPPPAPSASFLEGWEQATLMSVAVLTVLVLFVSLVSRARHHVTLSAA